MSDPVLYNYFRSSTSIRVRAALNLKGIRYAYAPVHLVAGEQRSESFRAMNPQGLVPALKLPDGPVLSQSLAIIEYLDEVQPDPRLLPADALGRARVRSLAYVIACEVHPLNNLRVLQELRATCGADEEGIRRWIAKWVHAGFGPLEQRLAVESGTGLYCHGDAPGLADVCLFAQMFNNQRFGVDMAAYPTVRRIFDQCLTLDAFRAAAPDAQPDAE